MAGIRLRPSPTVSSRRCSSRYDSLSFGQRRFGLSDLLFEFQDDLTVGFVQQAFVRCEPLGFIFGVEIVRIGFEKDVEDVAVAFGNIFHHRAQRVVAGFEPGVFAPQLIGGVLELVFDGRVEEEREPDVVEDGCAEPHQYVKRDADRLLFGRARCGVFDRSAGSCHVIRRRYRGWAPASVPSGARTPRWSYCG